MTDVGWAYVSDRALGPIIHSFFAAFYCMALLNPLNGGGLA